jgi:hypothetical protein
MTHLIGHLGVLGEASNLIEKKGIAGRLRKSQTNGYTVNQVSIEAASVVK